MLREEYWKINSQVQSIKEQIALERGKLVEEDGSINSQVDANIKELKGEEMKINNYNQFLTESTIDRITTCSNGILYFLKDNGVNDWNDFVNMSQFKRDVINKMIDEEVRDMKELGEVRFNSYTASFQDDILRYRVFKTKADCIKKYGSKNDIFSGSCFAKVEKDDIELNKNLELIY